MRFRPADFIQIWLVWRSQRGLEKKPQHLKWIKAEKSWFLSFMSTFGLSGQSSFHIPLLMVGTCYFLRCTILWPTSVFCVPQSYFPTRSDFLRILLLLKILLFCFSSECLLPPHHQININLDNSKYLLFSSYSHTCPHSTSHIQCLPTLISSWKTYSSRCSKTALWVMRRKLTLLPVLQSLMIHNRFYLHCALWRRNCCRCKKLHDLPKVIKKVNG